MKKVMIFGTFDILHIGHVKFIQEAANLGEKLVVVISRDQTVEEVKDKRTFHKEEERREVLQAISEVDKAILGNIEDKYKVIREEKPDIIALGYDQNHFVDKLDGKLNKFGLDTEITRLEKYEQGQHKSSKIREMYNI